MLLYPEMSGMSAKNDVHFKVLDKMIQIRSIDITEEDLYDFDELQQLKFKKILAGILA